MRYQVFRYEWKIAFYRDISESGPPRPGLDPNRYSKGLTLIGLNHFLARCVTFIQTYLRILFDLRWQLLHQLHKLRTYHLKAVLIQVDMRRTVDLLRLELYLQGKRLKLISNISWVLLKWLMFAKIAYCLIFLNFITPRFGKNCLQSKQNYEKAYQICWPLTLKHFLPDHSLLKK